MAATPRPSTSGSQCSDPKSPPLPAWQQRQLQRRNYLNDSLAAGIRRSPSAILETLDFRGDVDSEHNRTSTLISTSLHSPAATSTRQPSLSSTSTSAAYHTSPQVKSTSQPSGPFPQAHSLSTARKSDSWATCSDHEGDNTLTSSADMANKGDSGAMLSAFDRKKHRELPPLNTSGFGVSQRPSTESSDDEKAVSEAPIKLKPRKSSLKPKDTTPKSTKSEEPELDEKARARGPTERENQILLKNFLEHVPPGMKAEDNATGPKSVFDWDTSDDEGKSKVRKFFKRLKPAEPKEIKPVATAGGKSRGQASTGEAAGTPRIASEICAAKSPSLSRMVEQSMWERGIGPSSGSSTMSPPVMVNRSSKTSSEAAKSPNAMKRGGIMPRPSPFAQASPTPGARGGDKPPRIAQPFRRIASDTDLRTKSGSSGNAFAQEEARKKMVPFPQDAIHGASSGENTTICYSDNMLSRPNFGQRVAERLKISPAPTYTQSPAITTTSSFTTDPSPFGMAHMPSPGGTHQAPLPSAIPRAPPPVAAPRTPTSDTVPRVPPSVAIPQTPSSGAAPSVSSPGGLPPGPEHPDWDDAVKWVKKEISKRKAKEAKEAKELQKDAKKDEKRIRRLRAGKDIVKRQSQQGLMPRKSIEQITEDDFETVGIAAMAAAKSTPTVGSDILGAFFTQMPGSAEDKARQANAIGHSLENHASLQLLSQAEPSAFRPRRESQAHYDAALRMLEGETPAPDQLVSPFESASLRESGGPKPSIGLGITSDEAALERERAIQQQAKAQLGIVEHRPAQSAEQHNKIPKAPTLKRVPYDPQMPPMRRMTTIEEADKENSSSNSGSTGKAGHSQKNHPGGIAAPNIDPIVENEETEIGGRSDITQVKQNIQSLRYGQRISDDSRSMESMMTDYIPAPLQIPKTRSQHVSPGFTGDSPASTHSPNVPVMHVSKSSQDLRPPGSGGFMPRRNSGFNQMIEQHSRMQAGKIGSHPAFRDDDEEHDIINRYLDEREFDDDETYYHDENASRGSNQKAARVDSGIGLGEHEVMAASRAKRVPTLMVPDEAAAKNAGDVDIQSLRRELSLAPLQLPGPTGPKHPHHHFTWYHEKIMCFGIHNPKGSQPPLPSVAEGQQAATQDFKETPTKGKLRGINVCQSCGIHCCRFANLNLQSRIQRGNDLTEEAARMKAEQQVEKLRQSYPNGIEEYDTFLTCLECDKKICPGCSTRCTEPHCLAVVCVDCTDETGICPVHNDEE